MRKFLRDYGDPGVFAPDAVRILIAAFDGAWQSFTSGAIYGTQRLTADIIELARQYGRYGYRKIAELLCCKNHAPTF